MSKVVNIIEVKSQTVDERNLRQLKRKSLVFTGRWIDVTTVMSL